ncbi:integral membrane protein [Colletotrichum sojae]|uniref:Integral membrane protein n=1 Tax=Colletotrichum sojae TaxID=2175907 RepID=A0A8H6IUW1_9PEZI|nr:integral membrane protein [Colletotrichum sojae]
MAEAPTSWLQNLGIAIEIVLPSLALIVVILRLYIRIDTKSLGWDDACVCAAMALAVALAVGSIICMKKLYIGIHYWDVPQPMDPTKGMIWIYIVGAVYNPILALVKQSVLIFLLRISGVKTAVRKIVWGTAIFNFALMVATFFTVIFQCIPIEMNWKPTLDGKCIKQFAFGISTACLTIVTDLIAVALPFYIFLGLKMNRKRKIGLIAVFMLGIIVTIVSVVRLHFLAQNFTDTSPDKNFSLGFCVSSIECNLAIITASGPALWPLIRRWIPHLKSSKDAEYYDRKYHTGQGWIRTGDGPHTMPAGSIGLKDMGSRRVQTEVRSGGSIYPQDSDEELMTGTGIMRTTNFAVTRNATTIRDADTGKANLE